MSEENTTIPVEAPATPPEGGGSSPSNADFKGTPAYQSMAQQIAEFQKEKADRIAADETAKAEAEAKSLESQGKYEEALKLRQAEIDKMKTDHAAELTSRDLRNGLLQNGCSNETFINGAISGYKEGDIGEYVKSLAEADANAAFFGQQQRQPVTPPGGGNIGGTGAAIKDLASYRQALRSDDPNVVAAAKQWGTDYIDSQLQK